MTERNLNLEVSQDRPFQVSELVVAAGSVAFLLALSNASFSKFIKDLVYNRQGGVSPTGDDIDEYHHIIPKNMLKRTLGISGKDVADNCVGLGWDEHKHKWDKLAAKGLFYKDGCPDGVPLTEIDPNTYVQVRFHPKHHHKKRRR